MLKFDIFFQYFVSIISFFALKLCCEPQLSKKSAKNQLQTESELIQFLSLCLLLNFNGRFFQQKCPMPINSGIIFFILLSTGQHCRRNSNDSVNHSMADFFNKNVPCVLLQVLLSFILLSTGQHCCRNFNDSALQC